MQRHFEEGVAQTCAKWNEAKKFQDLKNTASKARLIEKNRPVGPVLL